MRDKAGCFPRDIGFVYQEFNDKESKNKIIIVKTNGDKQVQGSGRTRAFKIIK